MSFRERLGAAWREGIVDRMPVPMAAPESQKLRSARMRIMVALALVGLFTLCWPLIPQSAQHFFAALVIGLCVFLALQIPVWARAKWKADDAFLFRERDDA